jgi:hypothetical protein
MQKERRLAMEAHPLYHEEETIPNVIDARHYFARKRYDHEYRWETTIMNTDGKFQKKLLAQY